MSASSLKGQLGVKSGPLAPTSAKWTTQMLVISHMENHYKKINKAKPAIDNRPPKSMVSSQKMRDRHSRKQIEKYGSRPPSRSSSRLTYRTNSVEEDMFDENQWDEPENEEERQVRDIMRTTLRMPLKAQHGIFITDPAAAAGDGSNTKKENHHDHSEFGTTITRPRSATLRKVAEAMRGGGGVGGGSRMGNTRPMSARSTMSLASNVSQVTNRSTANRAKATHDGDVLHKHAHSFTQPAKAFTPRTLKTNRQSSLKQYKYYTPPPKKTSAGGNRELENSAEKEDDPPVPARPRRSKGAKDMGETQMLTETMLMDMSLQSHDPRQGQGQGGRVPRLDITMDNDRLNWVKDQAARVQGSDGDIGA